MLRYPGGKWKMAPWILSHFPQHEVYVEVFGGGASVLMQKAPSRTEIYNGIDSDVVNIFRVMRDPEKANRLMELLRRTPFASEEYEDCWVPGIDEIDQARKMIARSFFGIGSDSIFRKNGFRRGFKNKKLDANNAFASYLDSIPYFVDRLRSVIIENLDFAKLIKLYDAEETLFYVDPPYMDEVCSRNAVIYAHPLARARHEELATLLGEAKGNVIISGYPSDLYDELYAGWYTSTHSAVAGGGSKRVEKIWLKRQEAKLF